MTQKIKLGEQIAGARVAGDILSGARKPLPAGRERDYLANCAGVGVQTLEYVRDHELAFKRNAEAVALLRRARIQLPGGDLQDEIRAFLADVDGGAR